MPLQRRPRTRRSSATRQACRRSPTGWTTSPASAGPCCGRCHGEQAIGAWRPAPGDLGLQVLEWWAYLADILTFYNERIANESYLRTATRPEQRREPGGAARLRAGPGIAATGNVAAMRSAAHPAEPLVIPAGMGLSSTATPGVPAQTFEVSAAASFTGPSSVPVTLRPGPPFVYLNGDGTPPTSVLLAGRVSGVKAGNQLVLVEHGVRGQTTTVVARHRGHAHAPDRPRHRRRQYVRHLLGRRLGAAGRAGQPDGQLPAATPHGNGRALESDLERVGAAAGRPRLR